MGGIELGKSPWENRIAFISASIAQRLSHGFPRRPMQSQTELKVTSGTIPDVDFSYLSFREAYLASRLSGPESSHASHPARSLGAHCCAAASYRHCCQPGASPVQLAAHRPFLKSCPAPIPVSNAPAVVRPVPLGEQAPFLNSKLAHRRLIGLPARRAAGICADRPHQPMSARRKCG